MKIIAFLACFLILGCSSKTTTEHLADGAKETISGIYNSLPKECQTKMTEVAFDGAMKQVESVKAECMARQEVLNQKIRQRNLLSAVLVALVSGLFFHKVRQFLFR